MPLTPKQKTNLAIGIGAGVLLVGGGIVTAIYFSGKTKRKTGAGGSGAGAGAGVGKDSPDSPTPDSSGDDPRCAGVFKLSRAQMLSELGLDPKTPVSGVFGGGAPVNVGTPMKPKWVTPISVAILRLRIMSKRGIVKCGHDESSDSFSGRGFDGINFA